MDSLENDPIFKANNSNRKLHREGVMEYIGNIWLIWSLLLQELKLISIVAHVIRRLPGLNQIQLNRII